MLPKTKKFISLIFISAVLFSFAAPIFAQTITPTPTQKAQTIEVPVPWANSQTDIRKIDPGSYIRNLFIFGFSFIGFLAVAAIVYGGILYSIPGQTGKGKSYIQGAMIGIILLFASYLILYIINPDLVNLNMDNKIRKIENIVVEKPSAPDIFNQFAEDLASEQAQQLGLTVSLPPNVTAKETYMYKDLQNSVIGAKVASLFAGLTVPIVITETTQNHGCITLHPGDTCPDEKKTPCGIGGTCRCDVSDHCRETAVDIRTGHNSLTEDQIKIIMQKLASDSCTYDLFFYKFPELNMNNGRPYGQAEPKHNNHIHYSISPSCK